MPHTKAGGIKNVNVSTPRYNLGLPLTQNGEGFGAVDNHMYTIEITIYIDKLDKYDIMIIL
jgi:hypothetical protein